VEPADVKRRSLLLTLSAATAFFLYATSCAQSVPALWLAQSPSAKIYLFGTVHLLRSGTQWRSPQLNAAIRESQSLYLEVANPADVAAAISSLAATGFDREHPLSTKLPKADTRLLDVVAKSYGLHSEAMFEQMQPWLVALMLTMKPGVSAGYSAANGVDLQIRSDFVAAGKPVLGLETFDRQVHVFSDLTQSTQIALLESELHATTAQAAGNHFDALINAWQKGDEDQLATLLQADDLTNTSFYKAMFTDRNETWANILAERLKGTGISFVAVGAGHLAGPGGVPALLAAKGYTVTRIQTTDLPLSATSPPTAVPPRATPIPQTLTAPTGWKLQAFSFNQGGMKADNMWVDPKHRAVIITGHVDVPGLSAADLDSFNAIFHQGLLSVTHENGALSSEHVKICGGRQNGIYNKLTIGPMKEDIVVGVSDRAYVAEYVRRKDAADDPAASLSLLSLCPP
jgi:uncharacterized protein YbaP (TraB family)